ncbi:MAG: helix-turn-helix transcriptional regulator [Salipiger marinus]|uniref:helix-turn-helix transcriptional regulator n=1 Tax=Salipiger marinus TaxID=555512 RepID=UPI00405A2C03
MRDDMIATDAGGILAFAPNQRRTVVERPVQGPYLADVLTLPLTRLEEAQRHEGLRPGPIAPRLDAAAAAMARLRLRVGSILTADMADHTVTAQVAASEDIIADLAIALADPDQMPASAGRRRGAQAISLMRDRHREPITLASLARELGCSCRSLQAAFREAGHATPQDVLAGIRLDAARIRLLSGGHSVTTSLDSGISHLGRFAAAYRRRFGEGPAQTLSART